MAVGAFLNYGTMERKGDKAEAQIDVCEEVMSRDFDVHYGEEEFRTVDAGIEAIEAVLTGENIHAKERLLFYLDWYMDPY